MRSFFVTSSIAAILLATAAPSFAQDAATPAPASAVTITGGAALTSDYRFRGISQTDKRFAAQGTFTVSHSSGLYVGTWASSIDDYIANGGDAEVDLYGGYKKTFSGTTLDVGLLYYYYPGSGGINSDFFEPYANVSHTFGPVGVKAGLNYAWKQHGLYTGGKAREDNLYLYGEVSAAIPTTPLTITGHLGHTEGPSYLSIGKSYTDWNVGAAYVYKNLTFGVSYVDTNKDIYSSGFGVKARDLSNAGVVASIGVTF